MGSHRKASWQREHVVEEGSLDIFTLFVFLLKSPLLTQPTTVTFSVVLLNVWSQSGFWKHECFSVAVDMGNYVLK